MRKNKKHPGRPSPRAQASALSPAQKRAFRLLAFFAPFLTLALAELVLRLSGYGYPTGFFQKTKIDGKDFYVNSDTFSYRFFPPGLARWPGPFKIAAEKPSGLKRIFIFGESAAMGDPQPSYGASRYLEVLLRNRYPNEKFEIVNLGITAINSHVILPIARESAAGQGDVWIIYMGNNEMVGPFGAATVFGSRGAPWPVVRLELAIQKTRIGQLALATFRKLCHKKEEIASWGGMRMFLNNQISPNDRRKETVYRNFQANLRDILRASEKAGARVVLSTVSVNLRDCPPFGSLIDSNHLAGNLDRFNMRYQQGIEAERSTNNSAAAQRFEEAIQLDPGFAESQFRFGRALLAMTNFAKARDHLQSACDNDALPFRADTRINSIIRDLAKKFSSDRIRLCDAEADLARASSSGAAGDESFFEHVHFNFDGNYRLARSWAKEVRKLMGPNNGVGGDWASQDECEQQLGLTDFNRAYVLQSVIRRMGQPPLSSQFNNPERLQRFQEEEARIQASLKAPNARARAAELYRMAIEKAPEDHYLYEGQGNMLESWGNDNEALATYRHALLLQPQDYYSRLRLGHLLGAQKKFADALDLLSNAARIRPSLPETWYELGSVQMLQENFAAARQSLARAIQLRPDDQTYIYYRIYCDAKLLAKANRHDDAISGYRRAIELLPNQWEAHFELGGELDSANQLEEALREFETAARLNPRYSRTHLNHGVLLAKLGRLDEAKAEFDETLRLEPEYSKAREYLAQIEVLKKAKK
jgi:tetratricopeptide (TPR) repeat protein